VKISLFELLQQSKNNREAMNQLLQTIKLDINDPKSFMYFMENIKTSQKPTITFQDHEVRQSSHLENQNPPCTS